MQITKMTRNEALNDIFHDCVLNLDDEIKLILAWIIYNFSSNAVGTVIIYAWVLRERYGTCTDGLDKMTIWPKSEIYDNQGS